MTPSVISAKSFLNVMKLPDDQRRMVLEQLGAKMMEQLRDECDPLQRTGPTGTPVAKSA